MKVLRCEPLGMHRETDSVGEPAPLLALHFGYYGAYETVLAVKHLHGQKSGKIWQKNRANGFWTIWQKSGKELAKNLQNMKPSGKIWQMNLASRSGV